MGKPSKSARADGDNCAIENKEYEDPTVTQQDERSKLLSVIIAGFTVGSFSIEFIMQFLDAGYEINSSEADQIKNAAIAGICHLFPEHLQKLRMTNLIFKLILDCGDGVVRIIFQALCNTPKGRYVENGVPGEVSLMDGLDNISDEINDVVLQSK
jgi:hypothetical protein